MKRLPQGLKTPKQIARLLGVSDATVRRWLRLKVLRPCRVGGRWRASLADAVAFALEAS